MARRLALFCTLFLCLFGGVATAGDRSPAVNDQIVEGQFKQLRYLTGFDLPISSSGKFRVGPGQNLVWHTQLPFESHLQISSSGITQRIGSEQIMQLPASRLPAVSLFGNLLRISLAQDWPQLDQQFGIQPRFDGPNWAFEIDSGQLTSRFGPGLPLEKIAMQGGLFIDQLILQRAQGDYDLITFEYQTQLPGGSEHLSVSTARPPVVDPLP